MGGGSRVAITVAPIFVVAALMASMQSAEATSYTVGGDIGWTNSPPNATFYSDWASAITFLVDDILGTLFLAPFHYVSQAAYESCDTSSTPISSDSPVSVTLTASSYFICTKGTHCNQGQKLAVTVSTNSSPSTPSTDTNSTTPSPPPPPPTNSASSPATAAATAAACVVFGLYVLARQQRCVLFVDNYEDEDWWV
ncbi:hypothetical protein V2J09_002868 [Rumex salicifolius]